MIIVSIRKQESLRPMVTELVSSARQLYEESCELLRDKAHNLVNIRITIIIIYIMYCIDIYTYNYIITLIH